MIILIGEGLILLVSIKGERWRDAALEKLCEKEPKEAIQMSNLLKRRGTDATICTIGDRIEKQL